MAKKVVKKKKKSKGGALSRMKYELSEALQKVIGKKISTRPEMMKKLWIYIKKHKLQDPDNKRTIIFDENFSAIFNIDGKGDSCDMFFLAKGISNHIRRVK